MVVDAAFKSNTQVPLTYINEWYRGKIYKNILINKFKLVRVCMVENIFVCVAAAHNRRSNILFIKKESKLSAQHIVPQNI